MTQPSPVPAPAPVRIPVGPDVSIVVNGRTFNSSTGVKTEMNYAEIAALVGVTTRQVVRQLFTQGIPAKDILVGENVAIDNGARFSVEQK